MAFKQTSHINFMSDKIKDTLTNSSIITNMWTNAILNDDKLSLSDKQKHLQGLMENLKNKNNFDNKDKLLKMITDIKTKVTQIEKRRLDELTSQLKADTRAKQLTSATWSNVKQTGNTLKGMWGNIEFDRLPQTAFNLAKGIGLLAKTVVFDLPKDVTNIMSGKIDDPKEMLSKIKHLEEVQKKYKKVIEQAKTTGDKKLLQEANSSYDMVSRNINILRFRLNKHGYQEFYDKIKVDTSGVDVEIDDIQTMYEFQTSGVPTKYSKNKATSKASKGFAKTNKGKEFREMVDKQQKDILDKAVETKTFQDKMTFAIQKSDLDTNSDFKKLEERVRILEGFRFSDSSGINLPMIGGRPSIGGYGGGGDREPPKDDKKDKKSKAKEIFEGVMDLIPGKKLLKSVVKMGVGAITAENAVETSMRETCLPYINLIPTNKADGSRKNRNECEDDFMKLDLKLRQNFCNFAKKFYKESGEYIQVTSTYRSQEVQTAMRTAWDKKDVAKIAAFGIKFRPGKTSLHTSGKAIDISSEHAKTPGLSQMLLQFNLNRPVAGDIVHIQLATDAGVSDYDFKEEKVEKPKQIKIKTSTSDKYYQGLKKSSIFKKIGKVNKKESSEAFDADEYYNTQKHQDKQKALEELKAKELKEKQEREKQIEDKKKDEEDMKAMPTDLLNEDIKIFLTDEEKQEYDSIITKEWLATKQLSMEDRKSIIKKITTRFEESIRAKMSREGEFGHTTLDFLSDEMKSLMTDKELQEYKTMMDNTWNTLPMEGKYAAEENKTLMRALSDKYERDLKEKMGGEGTKGSITLRPFSKDIEEMMTDEELQQYKALLESPEYKLGNKDVLLAQFEANIRENISKSGTSGTYTAPVPPTPTPIVEKAWYSDLSLPDDIKAKLTAEDKATLEASLLHSFGDNDRVIAGFVAKMKIKYGTDVESTKLREASIAESLKLSTMGITEYDSSLLTKMGINDSIGKKMDMADEDKILSIITNKGVTPETTQQIKSMLRSKYGSMVDEEIPPVVINNGTPTTTKSENSEPQKESVTFGENISKVTSGIGKWFGGLGG